MMQLAGATAWHTVGPHRRTSACFVECALAAEAAAVAADGAVATRQLVQRRCCARDKQGRLLSQLQPVSPREDTLPTSRAGNMLGSWIVAQISCSSMQGVIWALIFVLPAALLAASCAGHAGTSGHQPAAAAAGGARHQARLETGPRCSIACSHMHHCREPCTLYLEV